MNMTPGTDGWSMEQLQEIVRAEMKRPRKTMPAQKVLARPVSDMDNNPMSPHRVTPSKLRFKDAADAINNKSYMAYYPVSAGPIADYYRDNGFAPPFQIDPEREHDWDRGVITIAGMMNLTESKIPFQLVHKRDILEIKQLVDLYVEEISPYIDQYPRLKVELKRCNKFLDYIDVWVRKVGGVNAAKGSLGYLLERIAKAVR